MSTPLKHALSSAEKFGGNWSHYIHIHDWLDNTKQYTGNWTHRALRHHSAGVQEAISVFGHVVWIPTGDGPDKAVPVKVIAEQHIIEDCGFIPTVQDWLSCINPKPWMLKVPRVSEPVKVEVKKETKNRKVK